MASPTLLIALLAAASPSTAPIRAPSPTPVIMGIKADRRREVVRVALLGFDVDHPPSAPRWLPGRLYCRGRAIAVTLRRQWQGVGAQPGGWVAADYQMDIPPNVRGKAVLSLGKSADGWSFRLAAT